MDPITRTPINTKASSSTSTKSLAKEILREFEFERSPNLQVTEGKLRLEETVDLCEAFYNEELTAMESSEKKLYYYISVKPVGGGNVPTFKKPCYGWKRKQCSMFQVSTIDRLFRFISSLIAPVIITEFLNFSRSSKTPV